MGVEVQALAAAGVGERKKRRAAANQEKKQEGERRQRTRTREEDLRRGIADQQRRGRLSTNVGILSRGAGESASGGRRRLSI